jgi:elongation factor P hydroxylase
MPSRVEHSSSAMSYVTGDACDQKLANAIEDAFAHCFRASHNTILVGGADEPLYQPATADQPAKLHYRADFPASALHEAAHWCIAGEARRQQEDFGYRYIGGPRTDAQQAAFFRLELHAQSLERRFAQASGLGFRPSADNLDADLSGFSQAIDAFEPRLVRWLDAASGVRARRLLAVLPTVQRVVFSNAQGASDD